MHKMVLCKYISYVCKPLPINPLQIHIHLQFKYFPKIWLWIFTFYIHKSKSLEFKSTQIFFKGGIELKLSIWSELPVYGKRVLSLYLLFNLSVYS